MKKMTYICIMKSKKIIDIAEYMGCDLKSRYAVRDFREWVENFHESVIEIDFKGVNFATRSFIDEFYRTFLKNADIDIELVNVPEDIQAMFDAVKSGKKKTNSKTIADNDNAVLKFSSVSDVNDYLNSLAF
jgi:phage terminase large subunit-like protein